MLSGKTWLGSVLVALYVLLALLAIGSSALRADENPGDNSAGKAKTVDADEDYKPKTKAELRKLLTRIQYTVTQEHGTEPAYRNAFWNNKQEGRYACLICEKPLFSSETKFESGTGWPSFWQPLDDQAVGTETDYKLVYPRTEVHCSRCKAHLGHVFKDGPRPTGLRYCMNSASMKFETADEVKQKQEQTKAKAAQKPAKESDRSDG